MEAGEGDSPRRRMVGFNEYEGPFGSIRFGGGFLYDFAAFSQDANSKQQFPDLSPEWKIRDTRLLSSGSFKTKRPISWSAGVMYDWSAEKWVMRQTHVIIAVRKSGAMSPLAAPKKASR